MRSRTQEISVCRMSAAPSTFIELQLLFLSTIGSWPPLLIVLDFRSELIHHMPIFVSCGHPPCLNAILIPGLYV